MKFALATLSAGLASALLATAVSAAPTVTLGLKYIGSVNGNLALNDGFGGVDSTKVITGAGILPTDPALQQVDPNSATYQTPSWKHFYAPTVVFTPDAGNTSERLRGLILNISVSGNISTVAPDPAFAQKYFGFTNVFSNVGNLAEWSQNDDAGTSLSDLEAITLLQQNYSNAQRTTVGLSGFSNNIKIDGTTTSQVSPTPVGAFAISFNAPGSGTINVNYGTGQSFSYFEATNPIPPNDKNYVTLDPSLSGGVTNASLVVGAVVPEPASLGLLAVGGLALLARRRKA